MEAKWGKEKESSGPAVKSIERWLSSNLFELINCPHQPGNLKISKSCCLKRYEASQKIDSDLFNQANLFYYTVWQGFLKCKTCSVIQSFNPDRAPLKVLTMKTPFHRKKMTEYKGR
jgi:hypothetical protein